MRTREKKKNSNNDFWLPKQSPAKPVCNTVFLFSLEPRFHRHSVRQQKHTFEIGEKAKE